VEAKPVYVPRLAGQLGRSEDGKTKALCKIIWKDGCCARAGRRTGVRESERLYSWRRANHEIGGKRWRFCRQRIERGMSDLISF